MKNYSNELTSIEKSEIAEKSILLALQNLGGSAVRKEILREIRNKSEYIPEYYIDEKKQGKNGEYSPFNLMFHFGIFHLELAGFIKTTRRGKPVELSQKGMECDPIKLDYSKDVYAIYREEEKKIKLEKANKKLVDEPTPDDEPTVSSEENIEEKESWREQLLEKMQNMNPANFEILCRRLAYKMGIDIDDASRANRISRDGGLDGYGYIVSDDFRTSRVAIQAKRYASDNIVQSQDIDRFRGSMDKFRAEFGIFITTSNFSRQAIKDARSGTRAITLIDGEKLLDLAAKYEIGVSKVESYVVNDNDELFNN